MLRWCRGALLGTPCVWHLQRQRVPTLCESLECDLSFRAHDLSWGRLVLPGARDHSGCRRRQHAGVSRTKEVYRSKTKYWYILGDFGELLTGIRIEAFRQRGEKSGEWIDWLMSPTNTIANEKEKMEVPRARLPLGAMSTTLLTILLPDSRRRRFSPAPPLGRYIFGVRMCFRYAYREGNPGFLSTRSRHG